MARSTELTSYLYLYTSMSLRHFIHLAYCGTDFSGWQIQPNAPTVQEVLIKAISTIYNQPIRIVGCGRTDTGVHALNYFAHMDVPTSEHTVDDLKFKLNNMLPRSIVVYNISAMDTGAHTRYDATSRSYIYKMIFGKDPFRNNTTYRFDQSGRPDWDKLQAAAALLLDYQEFLPFCKTHADSETYLCDLQRSEWLKISEKEWHYHVKANRFLRGMVRLIVGMTLNVALGRVELSEVAEALDKQQRLEKAWAVPASGLYLSEITYPYAV